MNNKICIISGPTASGKTMTSIRLAKLFGGEIINFDSLLFYQELNIGTAKPDKNERAGIPHHMIDTSSIKSPLNAADFKEASLPILENLLEQNKLVYLVGGSGFYLQALLYGMYDSKTTPEEIIQKSNKLFASQGIKPFLDILEEHDPQSFNTLHENDHYRLRRAVEYFWTNKISFSKAQAQMKVAREIPFYERKNWSLHHIYLDLPKPEHFEIIQKRTKKMFQEGLLEEVENLLKLGFTGLEKPLQSIGYKESLRILQDKDYNQDEAIQDIDIATRQLAKAQRTWFKKWDKHTYHPIQDADKIINDFKKFIGG